MRWRVTGSDPAVDRAQRRSRRKGALAPPCGGAHARVRIGGHGRHRHRREPCPNRVPYSGPSPDISPGGSYETLARGSGPSLGHRPAGVPLGVRLVGRACRTSGRGGSRHCRRTRKRHPSGSASSSRRCRKRRATSRRRTRGSSRPRGATSTEIQGASPTPRALTLTVRLGRVLFVHVRITLNFDPETAGGFRDIVLQYNFVIEVNAHLHEVAD
jgi:hypothetical protein